MSFNFANLWRRMMTNKFTSSRGLQSKHRKLRKPVFRLQMEELESRTLPSASIVSVPPNISVPDYRMGMTGVNANETILTPADVNANSFGKVWDNEQIEGQVYAQP